MDSTISLAALVAAGAPDHSQHVQHVVRRDDDLVEALCSCGVGLTFQITTTTTTEETSENGS